MISRLRALAAPYQLALGAAGFRRLMSGYGISALGDGAGYVAVAWLATELASPAHRPLAVAFALAAYLLPGALLGLAAGRYAPRLDPRTLIALDAAFRLCGLGVIATLGIVGKLGLLQYVVLLAASSLFHSVGSGGVVSLVGVHVAREHRFAANSLVEAVTTLFILVVGPAIGGLFVALLGAEVVLAIDAATFLALLLAVTTIAGPGGVNEPTRPAGSGAGIRALLRRPAVAWLLWLTVIFYGFYGPVETALPILVQHDLRSGPALLGAIWAAFGFGALAGGLAAGTRVIRNLRRFALTVVAGWGLALMVVAATLQPVVILAAITAGGFIYAPYPAAATTLLQSELAGDELTAGAIAWNSVAATVVPAGTIIGGVLVASLGARGTMGASALATIGLAAVVTLVFRTTVP